MRLNLSQRSFKALLRQSKSLEPKQCCWGSVVSTRIYWAFYGPIGVRCQCENCGRYGEMQRITEYIGTEGAIGTPVTERSLIHGIRRAVISWNDLFKEVNIENDGQK